MANEDQTIFGLLVNSRWLIGRLLRVWIALTCIYVYGFLRLLLVVKGFIFGGHFFAEKSRKTPPPCLEDPAIGRHKTVKLKDITLHYVENGDSSKPLMIFLHGFPDFWFTWRKQMKEFKSKYWVVALDTRGYGLSDKPKAISQYRIGKLVDDIREFIHRMGVQEATIVGHDWGAVQAWEFAAMHPHMVHKLIIMNGPYLSHWREVIWSDIKQFIMSWYTFYFRIPYIPEADLRSNDHSILQQLYGPKSGGHCKPDELEAYKYSFSQPGVWTSALNYYRANVGLRFHFYNSKIKKITTPTLVVWGANDIALTTTFATDCSKYVENLTIKIVQDAGHWIQHVPEVNNFIWHFMESEKS